MRDNGSIDRPGRKRQGTMRKHARIRPTSTREAIDVARLAQAFYQGKVPVQLLMEEAS